MAISILHLRVIADEKHKDIIEEGTLCQEALKLPSLSLLCVWRTEDNVGIFANHFLPYF